MRLLDLLWWFVDLDKKSGNINKIITGNTAPFRQDNEYSDYDSDAYDDTLYQSDADAFFD